MAAWDKAGMVVEACAWGAAICLTVYPAAAIARIIRRKSSADYSLPALCIVVAGLAMYEVTIWESPGRVTGAISLGWNCLMLVVVARYRLWPRPQPSRPLPHTAQR